MGATAFPFGLIVEDDMHVRCSLYIAVHLCAWLLAFVTSHYTLGVTGFAPLHCDLSVLVKLQAASSLFTHRLRTSAQTDSQQERFSAPVTSLSALCLVLWTSTCMCLIVLFERASAHILRAFYSADIGRYRYSAGIGINTNTTSDSALHALCLRSWPAVRLSASTSAADAAVDFSAPFEVSSSTHCNNGLRDAFQCISVHCAA